jgi:glycosyltransferase involved in cell wall biosynthesis
MPASAVDVSVILATYQQFPTTRLALQALFAQLTDRSYEVIVCDDGSDQETIAGLAAILESAPVPAYLVRQQDRGFRLGASRNNGARLARGRVLAFLDGDLVPEADFVDGHFRAHQDDRTIAVGKRSWCNPDAVSGATLDAWALWDLLRTEAADPRSEILGVVNELNQRWSHQKAAWSSCYGCNLSLPNSPLVRFDEAMVGWGDEDLDLAYGLNVVHGFQVAHIPVVAYDVRGWVDRSTTWQQKDYIAHLCNAFRFLEKWAHTGMTAERAIPNYTLDPATGNWAMTPMRRRGHTKVPPDYEFIHNWLVERGHLPAKDE